MSDEDYTKGLESTRDWTRKKIRHTLEENKIDVIMGPADGRIASIAAAAGYPVATVPLGLATNFNGRAFGMNIIAPDNQEGKIFEVMSAWEATFGRSKPPPILVKWDEKKVRKNILAWLFCAA